MGLLKNIFGSKSQPDNKQSQTPSVDFDALVEKAKASGQREDLNILYKHFFELTEWVYITPSRLEAENAKPFIGLVDEKPWVFIFTDGQKAHNYCTQTDGFIRNDGSSFLIKMKVKNSLDMLIQLANRGVFGIRINEGQSGWFCTIQDLPNIIKYLGINIG